MNEDTSILIVDDHSIVRTGVKMLVNLYMRPISVEEASNGVEMETMLKKQMFQLVILDINMPDTDTHQLVYSSLMNYPNLKILIYSMSPEEIYAPRYYKMGVCGFLSKDTPKEDLLTAIKTILQGDLYFSPKMLRLITTKLWNKEQNRENVFETLSQREFETMTHLLKGKSIKEISVFMNLHPSTIGTQKARIFSKLGVKNIIELKELAELNHLDF